MILTCPDCSTRYSTKPEAIGPNGRTVRCANCSATWFVAAEPDIMELKEQQRAEEIVRETPVSAQVSVPMSDQTGFGSSSSSPSSDRASEFGNDVVDKPVMGAHVQIRDMADQRRRNQRLMGISMVWVITLGALIAAALLGYFLRHKIVERAPAAASIYQAFGISVKDKGLDFENPKTRNVVLDGQPTLVVNGHIRNRSAEARQVPLIELSLVNASGEKIVSWAVQPSKDMIPAGGRMEYISEYPDPPIDAASLKYRFLDDDEVVPALNPEKTSADEKDKGSTAPVPQE